MSIAANISRLEAQLDQHHCKLIAVSKTKPPETIMEAYSSGFRRFGENRVQELVDKQQQLPTDIEWHMIGHLQRNKVKYLAPFVSMIHGVDNLKLLREINKQAGKAQRIIPCLLQVHIAQEESKFGFKLEELPELLKSAVFEGLEHVQILGLMGMATFTNDRQQIQSEFRNLKELFNKLDSMDSPPNFQMKELSMGMSNDFEIALEEGSTMVRIGSSIFGARN